MQAQAGSFTPGSPFITTWPGSGCPLEFAFGQRALGAAACRRGVSGSTKHDGGPAFHPDETRVPGAGRGGARRRRPGFRSSRPSHPRIPDKSRADDGTRDEDGAGAGGIVGPRGGRERRRVQFVADAAGRRRERHHAGDGGAGVRVRRREDIGAIVQATVARRGRADETGAEGCGMAGKVFLLREAAGRAEYAASRECTGPRARPREATRAPIPLPLPREIQRQTSLLPLRPGDRPLEPAHDLINLLPAPQPTDADPAPLPVSFSPRSRSRTPRRYPRTIQPRSRRRCTRVPRSSDTPCGRRVKQAVPRAGSG